jgi:hypothetical protein
MNYDANKAETTIVPIEKIIMDEDCQMRPSLDNEVVGQYARDMRQGDKFPAIRVVYDKALDRYWLTDGFHTINACLMAGKREHAAVVTEGTKRDAILQAIGANPTHGLRRCAETKRKAVRQLLLDPEWSQWSLRAIAEAAAVSVGLVHTVKEELEAAGDICRPQTVMFKRNGQTIEMNTAGIGQAAATSVDNPLGEPLIGSNGETAAAAPADCLLPPAPAADHPPTSPTLNDQRALPNTIVVGDCLPIMTDLPTGQFTLIVTSPPTLATGHGFGCA